MVDGRFDLGVLILAAEPEGLAAALPAAEALSPVALWVHTKTPAARQTDAEAIGTWQAAARRDAIPEPRFLEAVSSDPWELLPPVITGPEIQPDELLILPGAAPSALPVEGVWLRAAALAALREQHCVEENAATGLSCTPADPTGFPRVLRDEKGAVRAWRDDRALRDGASSAAEVFTGVLLADRPALRAALERGRPPGSAGTVTALVDQMAAQGSRVGAYHLPAETPLPPAAGSACARCSLGPERSAATGVLERGRCATLAVERPGFNSGQLVIVPHRHLTNLISLREDELAEIGHWLRHAERLLKRCYQFDALNIGISSGCGEHLALQVVPRWRGDLNYLPLVSGLKPVPESPAEAWKRLQEVKP